MESSNIITGHIIPNLEGTLIQIGIINTQSFSSTEDVLSDAVRIGNELDADWIVGFNFQSQPTTTRMDRRWSGFGTAVKINQTRRIG